MGYFDNYRGISEDRIKFSDVCREFQKNKLSECIVEGRKKRVLYNDYAYNNDIPFKFIYFKYARNWEGWLNYDRESNQEKVVERLDDNESVTFRINSHEVNGQMYSDEYIKFERYFSGGNYIYSVKFYLESNIEEFSYVDYIFKNDKGNIRILLKNKQEDKIYNITLPFRITDKYSYLLKAVSDYNPREYRFKSSLNDLEELFNKWMFDGDLELFTINYPVQEIV